MTHFLIVQVALAISSEIERIDVGQGTGTSCLLRKFSGGLVKPILLVSHWQELSLLATPRCKGRVGNLFILGFKCPGSKLRVLILRNGVRNGKIDWQHSLQQLSVVVHFNPWSSDHFLPYSGCVSMTTFFCFPFCLFLFYLNA